MYLSIEAKILVLAKKEKMSPKNGEWGRICYVVNIDL